MMAIVVDSEAWTGRGHYHPTPAGYIARWLHGIIFRPYECEDCIGMMIPHGCYCSAMDAVAPCTPAEPWRLWLREKLLRFM